MCEININCCNGEGEGVMTVNGVSGPDVLLGLQEILLQGNITDQSIVTSAVVEALRLHLDNGTAITRVLTNATITHIAEFPDASGVILLNTSPLKEDNLVSTMFATSATSGTLAQTQHMIYTGTVNAIWSLPSPVGYYGKTVMVTNQGSSPLVNLNIDVVGGGAEIFYFGAPAVNINIVAGDTTHFKSDGTFWYPC